SRAVAWQALISSALRPACRERYRRRPRRQGLSTYLAAARRPLPEWDRPPSRYANECASSREECRGAASWFRHWRLVPLAAAQSDFPPPGVQPPGLLLFLRSSAGLFLRRRR